MTNKPFDWFIVLACVVFGVIMLVAGFIMGQPTRIVTGVLFMTAGPLSFIAFDTARKRRRK
jgi:Flp pilus assembly protein TadB